jgi:2-polyprenyl-6-methoxyphenol hydroxylase-like FAD-dependent oxidoreductase
MTRAVTERVVIVGAGAAGLLAAVFLARTGRQILVVERDAAPASAPGAGAAIGEARPGLPQARHSHAYLASFRALLTRRSPDLLAALLTAGAREIPLLATAPAGGEAGRADDLVVLGCRRPLLDEVLRAAVLAEPGVSILAGSRVAGLVVDAGPGRVPRVRGLRLADGTILEADLVVDAGGRLSPVRDLLATAGATLPAELGAPCGITYYSRFYARAHDSLATPLNRGHTAGASFDRYSCLVFPADNATFSITFGVLPEDAELRLLRHDSAFDAAVRAIGPLAPWLDGLVATDPRRRDSPAGAVIPLGPVAAMAGLRNTFRPWVADGRPAALGVLPIGDAALITNPAHTRGTTLAALGAAWLTDVVTATADPGERALRLDAITRAEGLPWYHDSREQDDARLARWRAPAPRAGTGPEPRADGPARVANGEAFLAAQRDPVVWHSFTRLQHLLARPADVLADPEIVARVRAVQASGWRPAPMPGPSRAELIATAAAALTGSAEPGRPVPGGPARDGAVPGGVS